jgi:hypothetical protein
MLRVILAALCALPLLAWTPAARADVMRNTVGNWTIVDENNQPIGSSQIVEQVPGDMLFETRVVGGGEAQLLWFARSERAGGWIQLFASPRGIREFTSGAGSDSNTLVYFGNDVPLREGLVVDYRLTLWATSPDRHRRLLEGSRDGGNTWETVFDYNYRRTS